MQKKSRVKEKIKGETMNEINFFKVEKIVIEKARVSESKETHTISLHIIYTTCKGEKQSFQITNFSTKKIKIVKTKKQFLTTFDAIYAGDEDE